MKNNHSFLKILAIFSLILTVIVFFIEKFFDGLLFSYFLAINTVFLITYYKNETSNSKNKDDYKHPYLLNYNNSINDYSEEIKKYFPELEEKDLLEILYNKFLLIQEALSKGDFDIIKRNCVDSLYETLYSQYKEYETKGKRQIMKDFSLHSYNIQNIIMENHTLSIEMTLHVSFLDNVYDKEGNMIKENGHKREHKQYVLEFIIDEEKKIVCPNCGASVKKRKCDFCKTVFKDVYYDFYLANMGLINNRS